MPALFPPATARFMRAALVALLLGSAAAHALSISPVVIELSATRRIATVTVNNPDDRAIRFQSQAFAWSQDEGRDGYAETDELVVVPPIATIAPRSIQIFRITTRRAPGTSESAYRLVLEDVSPDAPEIDNEATVHIRVNHNLPVFVAPPGSPRAQLRVRPCATEPMPRMRCVRVANEGGRYAQIRMVTLESGSASRALDANLRILAGAWREWTFDVPPANAPHVLRADTLDGPVTLQLPPSTR